jgi:hypothetical protein
MGTVTAIRAGKARASEQSWRDASAPRHHDVVNLERAVASHVDRHAFQEPAPRAEHRAFWLAVCVALAFLYELLAK